MRVIAVVDEACLRRRRLGDRSVDARRVILQRRIVAGRATRSRDSSDNIRSRYALTSGTVVPKRADMG